MKTHLDQDLESTCLEHRAFEYSRMDCDISMRENNPRRDADSFSFVKPDLALDLHK